MNLLVSVASEFPVSHLDRVADRVTFQLAIAMASGEVVPFKIAASPGPAQHVIAREIEPKRLPAFCPERHINSDGSFCINWIQGDPRPVVDTESARAWWASLEDYLRLQVAASKLRRWPGPAWAHGHAAEYQRSAEAHARTLGEPLLSQVTHGSLTTRLDYRRGHNRIELRANGEVLNRINLPFRKLTNLQMPCPCPEGTKTKRPIGQCGQHAEVLAALIESLHRRKKAEDKYIADLRKKHIRCCGTLDRCPLK